MQCRECGYNIASQALFCPSCGARLVTAAPAASASQEGVPSSHFLGADMTQAQPIVPAAVRGPRPAPQPGPAAALVAAAPVPVAKSAAGGSASAQAPANAQGQAKLNLPKPGDTLADRYRVEKFLGQGSLSNAYLCRDLKGGNREVVVKAMHARKASEAGLAESYLFLADSVAKYDHRGIAKTFEAGLLDGAPYYAMEWVSGTPLRMWLMERLTFENRVLPGLGLVRSLIDIFEAVHERGCYGCLKPENVFVGLSGPVVMDFGVVGFLTPQEFEFNSYARRYLPYMAPELRQDWSNLIPHSDYYSLGAILYEVLTGRAPTSPLRLPSELSDLFGIEADEIILKALAPKPLDRFGTLEAFRLAVESLQAALLGAQAPQQPGSEGSRSMQVAKDAFTVNNPDETFTVSFPTASLQDASFLNQGASTAGLVPPVPMEPLPSANPFEAVSAPEAPEAVPADHLAPSPLGSREGEAAHAMRRFTHSPKSAFPEGELPAPSPAGAWESLTGDAAPDQAAVPEEAEEPVPAWLWISIALAGCSMLVLSAYFGLLLPKF